MKSHKFLIITVITLLLLFSLYFVFRQISAPGGGQTASSTPQISIPTANGQIQISDITQHPVEQVTDTVVFARTNQYEIAYFPNEQSFTITISAEPVEQARQAAEQAFLDKLQITEGQACQLNVTLAVLGGIDENLAGKNYGLSFCSNGISFPQE